MQNHSIQNEIIIYQTKICHMQSFTRRELGWRTGLRKKRSVVKVLDVKPVEHKGKERKLLLVKGGRVLILRRNTDQNTAEEYIFNTFTTIEQKRNKNV